MQTDEYGFEYYTTLPANAKLARNIWSFVTLDRKEWNFYRVNLGMKYILYASTLNRYEIYEINEDSTDKELLNYIESEQLYILS